MDKNLAHIRADWGICIDIFPLFPLGNNEEEICRSVGYFKKVNKYCLKYLMINTLEESTGITKFKKRIHGLIPDGLSVRLTEKYLQLLGENKKMEDVKYCTCGTSDEIIKFPTEWFKEREYVAFEDMTVPIMKEYDLYLKAIYGDYMQLPEEEDRVCHVNDNIILKFDEPYQNYYV